jgi:Helix-turn-helix domain
MDYLRKRIVAHRQLAKIYEAAAQDGREFLNPDEQELVDALQDTIEEILNSKQAAKKIKVSPPTLCEWRQQGRGPPFISDGKVVRYRLSVLERWLAGDPAARLDGKDMPRNERGRPIYGRQVRVHVNA